MTAGQRDNFSGDLSLTAPTGGVTKGLIYNIEDSYVVARETADATASFLAAVSGPIRVTKLTTTGIAFAAGDKVFFDGTSKATTTAATTGDTQIGIAIEAAVAADTEVLILLGAVSPTVS